MMLAEGPAGLITVISPPPGAGALVVPENRVTTASPGCSGPCCAKAADNANCRERAAAATIEVAAADAQARAGAVRAAI